MDQDSLTRREAIGLLGLQATMTAAAAQNQREVTTAVGIAEVVRKRKVSAVEVLKTYLQRIERVNAPLNAFVYLDAEAALKQARSIDERIGKGEDPVLWLGCR